MRVCTEKTHSYGFLHIRLKQKIFIRHLYEIHYIVRFINGDEENYEEQLLRVRVERLN